MAKTPASLSLLKGGSKTPPATPEPEKETQMAEQATVAPEPEVEDEEVDLSTMDGPAIDALVKKHGISVPKNWSKMSVENKRGWLEENAGGDETPDEASAETPAATPVETKAEPEAATTETPAAAPAKTAKVTKTTKNTAVAKNTAKSGEVSQKGDDALNDIVHEIETLKEKQARSLVGELSEQADVTFFRLGGVLSVILKNGWWTPYASFREFVEKEHGLHYRKATYWVGIYNDLIESNVPWDKVSSLGWTKLKEIASIITPENVDEWVKIAKTQNTISLIETVKKHKASGAQGQLSGDGSAPAMVTKTFKVTDDQKATVDNALAKAREETSTTSDAVALEYIAADYLSNVSMVQKLRTMGFDAAVEKLSEAFPELNMEISVTDATEGGEGDGAEAA